MDLAQRELDEIGELMGNPAMFVQRYVQLYDATLSSWQAFVLWPAQEEALRQMHEERLLVVLKARQLGLSWLTLAYCLYVMVFYAPATVLLFSMRAVESQELLQRLAEMHGRLPVRFRGGGVVRDGGGVFEVRSGSRALAFSTKGGRSYTGTVAVVDEADYVPDLGRFLNGVKPTIDAGGKLFLISTADKRRPVSVFKNLFRAAEQGTGDYRAVFLPWWARPERDAAWYARTKAEMFAQRGTDDDFYAEYPASPEEALAAEQLDRRLPAGWVLPCVDEGAATVESGLGVPGLSVWEVPVAGVRYVIGVDPAEGNVASDESVACVMRSDSWAQVAVLAGRMDPSVLVRWVVRLAGAYGEADVMVERNNHGHSVLLGLREAGVRVLNGYDGKPGWLSNVKGKPLMYDGVAAAVRERQVVLRDSETVVQLCSLEASTLRAPAGLADDRADAFALALAALVYGRGRGEVSEAVTGPDALEGVDRDEW